MTNHNVRLAFWLRGVEGVSLGIWALSALSTLIVTLEGGTDAANEVRPA